MRTITQTRLFIIIVNYIYLYLYIYRKCSYLYVRYKFFKSYTKNLYHTEYDIYRTNQFKFRPYQIKIEIRVISWVEVFIKQSIWIVRSLNLDRITANSNRIFMYFRYYIYNTSKTTHEYGCTWVRKSE